MQPDPTGMLSQILYDHTGGREAFLAEQTGVRREDVRWAVEHGHQTIPMPDYAHAEVFEASSGGRVVTWDGDPRSHADALGQLYALTSPEALEWLTGPA